MIKTTSLYNIDEANEKCALVTKMFGRRYQWKRCGLSGLLQARVIGVVLRKLELEAHDYAGDV